MATSKVIGILCGQERSFPDAFIARVNERGAARGIRAEYATIDATRYDQSIPYDVLVDRISHEVLFYRSYLKHAVLEGAYVINDPFTWSAKDDKFFGYNLGAKVGVAVPKTVLLPQHDHPDGIVAKSLHNMKFPLDWQAMLAYTGLPAIIKPMSGGGWKDVHIVRSLDELLYWYNQTGTKCMVLQEFIDFDLYVRCICVGRKFVLPIKYNPKTDNFFERYVIEENFMPPALEKQIREAAMAINLVFGYDMNSVEFAVRDGVPYAIDYTNPAPDMDEASIKTPNFVKVVEAMSDFAMECAAEGRRSIKHDPFYPIIKRYRPNYF